MGYDVGWQLGRGKFLAGYQAYGYSRVEMTSGNGANGVGHRQHSEAEREGDAHEADAQAWKRRGKHGASATAKDQPKRSKAFRSCTLGQRHMLPSHEELYRPRSLL